MLIDARAVASGRLSRTQIEFTDQELHQIALTYHRWRGTEFSDGVPYADEKGFCVSASNDEIEKHDFLLTPSRYVGSQSVDEDVDEFITRMKAISTEVFDLMQRGAELDAVIKQRIERLGYGD